MACGEFELIARYFNRQGKRRNDVETGIGDDCALMNLPTSHTLAISTDTLVVGTHFLAEIDPADLGHKALAVNLSDLAAMGADPAWLTLALTLPAVDEPWLQRFSDALFQQLESHHMQLIGGDTTRGSLAMTLSVHGLIPQGQALKRSTAQVGDAIYVTGPLGDSAAGLALLLKKQSGAESAAGAQLIQRHLRPTPRVAQGRALRGLASAAIDISDGLLADLGHILQASQVGAEIQLEALPLSEAQLSVNTLKQARQFALYGGEDYELCFTVPESRRQAVESAFQGLNLAYYCIGEITAQAGELTLREQGREVNLQGQGFQHFPNPDSKD